MSRTPPETPMTTVDVLVTYDGKWKAHGTFHAYQILADVYNKDHLRGPAVEIKAEADDPNELYMKVNEAIGNLGYWNASHIRVNLIFAYDWWERPEIFKEES